MLVFFPENLVCLSLPKTGTTALQHALRARADIIISDPPVLKHIPLYRYSRFMHPLFQTSGQHKLEIMAIMREPISWLGSWYRFRQRPFMQSKANSTHGISFDQFVLDYLKDTPPPHANVGRQSRFLAPQDNGLRINHLFRFEDLQAPLNFLEMRLRTKIELPVMNSSPCCDMPLSSATKAKLKDKCAADFTLYDSIP
jgi:hypothetical protein